MIIDVIHVLWLLIVLGYIWCQIIFLEHTQRLLIHLTLIHIIHLVHVIHVIHIIHVVHVIHIWNLLGLLHCHTVDSDRLLDRLLNKWWLRCHLIHIHSCFSRLSYWHWLWLWIHFTYWLVRNIHVVQFAHHICNRFFPFQIYTIINIISNSSVLISYNINLII